MPAPKTEAIVEISVFLTIADNFSPSVFKILPRNGNTAWWVLSRTSVNNCAAESPSVINKDFVLGSLPEATFSFDETINLPPAFLVLRASRAACLAFFAASFALRVSTIFSMILWAAFVWS